jgi:hypothetical protein
MYLWEWFIKLDSARSGSGWSIYSIGYPDIAAFASLHRLILADWEISAIRAMDVVRMSELVKSKDEPKVSTRKLGPSLFHALFKGGKARGR